MEEKKTTPEIPKSVKLKRGSEKKEFSLGQSAAKFSDILSSSSKQDKTPPQKQDSIKEHQDNRPSDLFSTVSAADKMSLPPLGTAD